MITTELLAQITAAIDGGNVSDDKTVTVDSVIAFPVDSDAFRKKSPGMPLGEFEHKGVKYVVYPKYK